MSSNPQSAIRDPRRAGLPAQVAWTLAARLLMAGNSLLAGVIIARRLGAETLGVFAVLNLAVAYAAQIGNLGLVSASTYFVARDERLFARSAANAAVFSAAAGSLFALVVVLSALAAPQIFGELPIALVAIAAAAVPFQLFTAFGLNLFLSVGRVARFNLVDALAQSAILVNALVALVLLGRGLGLLIGLNTAAAIAVCCAVFAFVARHVARGGGAAGRWRADAALLRRMIGYGLRVHLQTAAGLLLFRADLLLVKYFRGAAEAGVYSVSSQVALLLMLLPGVVSTLLFPRIAAARDESGALACRAARHTAFVMAAICLAAVPAVFALPLLYGERFADAPAQSLILLPGVLLVSVAGVLAQHFSGTGLPLAVPLFWVAALALNVALNVALVPAWGARGAALSSSVSYAAVFLCVAFYFRARTGARLRDAFVLRGEELRALLPSATPGAAAK